MELFWDRRCYLRAGAFLFSACFPTWFLFPVLMGFCFVLFCERLFSGFLIFFLVCVCVCVAILVIIFSRVDILVILISAELLWSIGYVLFVLSCFCFVLFVECGVFVWICVCCATFLLIISC